MTILLLLHLKVVLIYLYNIHPKLFIHYSVTLLKILPGEQIYKRLVFSSPPVKYPGIGKVVVQIQTTLPTIQCEQKSPHLRRVELVNVGTFVGCRSETLFDREVRRPVHSDLKREVFFPGASPAVCESTGRRTRAPQMIRTSLSNRAAREMSGTAPAASSEGKRD